MLEQVIADSLLYLGVLGWALLGFLLIIIQIIFRNSLITLWASVVGLIVLLTYCFLSFAPDLDTALFFGRAKMDSLTQFMNILGILISLGVILMSIPGLMEPRSEVIKKSIDQTPEFLICIVLAGFGLGVTVSSLDFTSLFLGIETLAIALYGLCGFYRFDQKSTESALKYLFVGAFSTCIFLFGIALIYGATGSTQFLEIYRTIEVGDGALVRLGCAFLVAGLGFKLALVPFHLYTPDVYEGSPTPVTAFLATVVKVAAIGAGLRIFQGALSPISEMWENLWISLCVLSIIFGNLAALQQKTIKKLLAFSSIAHAGFLGLGLIVASDVAGGYYALLAYLFVYCAMSLGIFAVVAWIENRDHEFLVSDLAALGLKRPWVGILMAAFILGLAGIPPFAGFMIKLWIFQALIEQGLLNVALLAVLGSVIGLAYYLRILMLLFMSDEASAGASVKWGLASDRAFFLRFVVLITLLVTLVGGLFPGFYADWILSIIEIK
jgi:NADH-quinone oxidoreductase subunit N